MAGTSTGGGRRSPFAPYLLVAPGVLWLAFFFLVPLATLARTSLPGRRRAVVDGYLRAFDTYGEHFARSFGYALAATLIALAARLSAGLRHGLPGRPPAATSCSGW